MTTVRADQTRGLVEDRGEVGVVARLPVLLLGVGPTEGLLERTFGRKEGGGYSMGAGGTYFGGKAEEEEAGR